MLIGNPKWLPQPPSWKSVLDISQTTRWKVEIYDVVTIDMLMKTNKNCADWKSKKAAILKINLWPLLPSGLSWNLHCSNRMTTRSKIAKIVPIGNPKWLPQQPSLKSIFICPFEKRVILCYGVWRPSVRPSICKLFGFRLTPPTVYIRSSWNLYI